MKKGFKVLLLTIGFGFILSSPLFAENATVTYVRGKVEVQRTDGNWYPLDVGDVVTESETISTGFYSDLKLEYNSSIIALGALTRVTLENLSSSSDKDSVSLYLNTGAVRSKVNHTKEKRVSYVVKSPVAVASVRGTDFTITANGMVTCNEGAVVVFPNIDISKGNAKKDKNEKVEEEEESEEETSSEAEETSSESSVTTSAVAIEDTAESSTSSDEITESNAGDYGPATSTTPAKAIANDAPAGAIVVAKSQTVSITSIGTTETPIANASKKSQQAKAVVTTAASQEAEIVGSSTVTAQSSAKEVTAAVEAVVIKTGKITAEIVLQD